MPDPGKRSRPCYRVAWSRPRAARSASTTGACSGHDRFWLALRACWPDFVMPRWTASHFHVMNHCFLLPCFLPLFVDMMLEHVNLAATLDGFPKRLEFLFQEQSRGGRADTPVPVQFKDVFMRYHGFFTFVFAVSRFLDTSRISYNIPSTLCVPGDDA